MRHDADDHRGQQGTEQQYQADGVSRHASALFHRRRIKPIPWALVELSFAGAGRAHRPAGAGNSTAATTIALVTLACAGAVPCCVIR
jgi:hypothetical protein